MSYPNVTGTAGRRADVAAAMRGLCDALGHLAAVRDALEERLAVVPPGAPEETEALAVRRACAHITQAAADVPQEYWRMLLADERTVGAEEFRARFDGLLAIAAADRAVPVPA